MNLFVIIILTIEILLVFPQFSTSLKPLTRCLGNCAICDVNALDTCSGTQLIQCVKGYDGKNCKLRQIMAIQIQLDPNNNHPLVLKDWDQNQTVQCSYKHKNGSTAVHQVLGLFKFTTTKIIAELNENYQNFMFSFNLVRTPWTPYSDLLSIVLYDENGDQLRRGFIEYLKREEINTNSNPLKCGNRSVITEKFQLDHVFTVGKIPKELHIQFQGIVNDGLWGITNAKVAFGCNNFLIYEGNGCSKCLTGYHQRLEQGKIMGCSICPTSCNACSSPTKCSSCIDGFTLTNQQCFASKNLEVITRPVPSTFFSCNGLSLRMSSYESSSADYTVIGPIQFDLPPHQQIRVIIQIAHTLNQEDRQSHSEEFFLDFDNAFTLDLTVMQNEEKPEGYCQGFGNGGKLDGSGGFVNGFYTWTKLMTPLLKYQGEKIVLKIKSANQKFFGIYEVLFQINERQQPEPQPEPQPQPEPEPQPQPQPKPQTLPQVQKPKPDTQPQTQSQAQKESINGPSPNPQQIPEPADSNQAAIEEPQQNNEKESSSEQKYFKKPDAALTPIVETIIKDMKDKIVFDTKADPEFHVSLKFPSQIEKMPFIYGKIKSTGTLLSPEKIRETSTYQILKFDLPKQLLDDELSILISDQQVVSTPLVLENKKSTRILFQDSQVTKLTQANFPDILKDLITIPLSRYDELTQEEIRSLADYATFFEVISWVIIMATIVLAFFGNSVITQDIFLIMQIMFLFVYIDSTYLPVTFRMALKGLHRTINMDYFAPESKQLIENWLLGNVIQESPLRFTQFHKDINFTRAVYPMIIINLVILVWFMILTLVRKFLVKDLVINEEDELNCKDKVKLFIIRISQRIMNFWYQIWQLQYLAFCWAAFTQLHNLSYPSGSDRSSIPNSIFCFIVIILIIVLPIVTMLYANKKYFRLDYFEYSYWYRDMFFLKLPSQSLPSNHHRTYILIRNIRLLLIAVFISFVGAYSIPACILLLLIHLFSLLYIKLTRMQIYSFNRKLIIIEHVLLILVTIIIIAAVSLSSTINKKQYLIIGHVITVMCLLILINGLIKVGYNCIKKMKSETVQKQLSQFKPAIATQRVV